MEKKNKQKKKKKKKKKKQQKNNTPFILPRKFHLLSINEEPDDQG